MSDEWDKVSERAPEWSSVSAPADFKDKLAEGLKAKLPVLKPLSKEDIEAAERRRAQEKEEKKRRAAGEKATAKREKAELQAEQDKERIEQAARKKQILIEKAETGRIVWWKRGQLIKQFGVASSRALKAVIPSSKIILITGATIMALVLMFKVASIEITNPWGKCDNGTVTDKKKDKVKGKSDPIPDGDGTPDDPKGIWGWDKYFKNGKKADPAS